MIGEWFGHYKYSNKELQNKVGVDKTYFRINILTFQDNKFTGTVEDDKNTRGTPGIGDIVGEIIDEKISFIKQMPVHATINAKGETIIQNKKHMPIYYSGILADDGKMINGKWEFKIPFIFKLLFPGKWHGTFEMEKTK